jgi:hypothetical protein
MHIVKNDFSNRQMLSSITDATSATLIVNVLERNAHQLLLASTRSMGHLTLHMHDVFDPQQIVDGDTMSPQRWFPLRKEADHGWDLVMSLIVCAENCKYRGEILLSFNFSADDPTISSMQSPQLSRMHKSSTLPTGFTMNKGEHKCKHM